ncbi:MAG TPA: dihydrofolate reductase family protein [Mariprofundaceae bacterium]|nr:dihydrofolate reductase family protein [Mariprofundaceae bacterium]
MNLNLHREAGEGDIHIYSNYVASLDGRISRFNPETGDFEVPNSLANARDWRLYQELAAQSDILITSARYFRQLATGTAQDMLPVGSKFEALKQWRLDQNLKAQPDVVIISNSLDIPIDAIEQLQDRSIFVFTSEHAPQGKRTLLESHGVTVVVAGERSVEGGCLRGRLIDSGFKSAYMIAGPQVHRMLIEADVLDSLFLTTRFRLMGNEKSHGFCEGELSQSSALKLNSLYLDSEGEQVFAHYHLKGEVERS